MKTTLAAPLTRRLSASLLGVLQAYSKEERILIRNDAVAMKGERSRPGCSSARPRAEHERAETHPMVWKYRAQKWLARARPTAPEAGALPLQTQSFRRSSYLLLAPRGAGETARVTLWPETYYLPSQTKTLSR